MTMHRPMFGFRDSSFRRLALRLFRTVNPGDITIRHHWTGSRLHLHSFKHKGYWWHGKRRERDTIERFYKLLQPGESVIEIGGHIGYLSLIFADIVGPAGRVIVFEPGANNLPYLRQNLKGQGQVEVIEQAVSDSNGSVQFWLEDLSGQNNSLIADYHLLKGNIELAGLASSVAKQPVTVECVTLDSFVKARTLSPTFLKVDVEGAELLVLQGAANLLATQSTALMVEVTREAQSIFALLEGAGYRMFFPDGSTVEAPESMVGNIFCLPDEAWVSRFMA